MRKNLNWKIACATLKGKEIDDSKWDFNRVRAWRVFHLCALLTFCANFECFRGFICALKVGIFVNIPVTSQLCRSHRGMLWTFDCDVDFPRVSVVCVWGEAPPFMCTSFGRPAGPADIRGESTSLPNVRSVFRSKQLSCEVTGVFTKARTSRAHLKPRKYSEFEQKVYSVHRWNDFQELAKLKSRLFESLEMSFWLAFVLVPRRLLYAYGHVLNSL